MMSKKCNSYIKKTISHFPNTIVGIYPSNFGVRCTAQKTESYK